MQASNLKRSYYRQLLPALGAIALAAGVRAFGLLDAATVNSRLLGVALFVLAIALAAALPVFIRAAFAHRVRLKSRVEEASFLGFQLRLMRTALLSTYLVPAGLLIDLPGFHQTGIFLAALYAVYYQYPSERRIGFDRRIFRVH
jgi:hypothetical protein